MDKFKNKYRIPSTRAPWWNYGWDAAYYITINTKNRVQYFGDIENAEMFLSAAGQIADSYWREIPDHAKNVKLGVHVVMPNHLHGILILSGNQKPCTYIGDKAATGTIAQSRFRNPGKNTISSIVGSYKSAVSHELHRLGYDFRWQARFHDHIIRDEAEYYRISEYIINNPANWKEEKCHLSANLPPGVLPKSIQRDDPGLKK